MQIDGITLRAVVHEIASGLAGARVDKVQSPSRDSITMYTGRGRAGALVISASPSHARLHTTDAPPQSLPEPTSFCMLLRKHLVGGKIASITQNGLDRVVIIRMQGWADLDPSENKLLIAELMGRRSNIVLTDLDGRILDAVNRVDQSVNRYRELLPGVQYIPPPPLEKPDPFETSQAEFEASLARYAARKAGGASVSSALASSFAGIGPDLAAEVVFRAGMDPSAPLAQVDRATSSRMWEEFSDFIEDARADRFTFEAAFDPETGVAVALSSGGLSHLAADYRIERFASACAMIDRCYSGIEEQEKMEALRRGLSRTVSSHLDRAVRKLAAQRMEYDQAQGCADLRRQGELLTANLHILGQGRLHVERVRVVDYYDPDMPELEVDVDPNLTASENAQRLFARYARSRRATEAIAANIAATEDEVEYLESVRGMIELAESVRGLGEIADELGALGYLQPARDRKARKAAKRGESGLANMPAHFRAESGHEIYVGRNNLQNDNLTVRLSRDQDLWFHAKDIPGSHVVVRRRGADGYIPEETIYAAAMLAAYYSRARMSSKVPVDYTERRNVHKPRGARPGMVIYDNQKTIFVTPSREEVARALGLSGGVFAGDGTEGD